MTKTRNVSSLTAEEKRALAKRLFKPATVRGAQRQSEKSPHPARRQKNFIEGLDGIDVLDEAQSLFAEMDVESPMFRFDNAERLARIGHNSAYYLNFGIYDYLGLSRHPDVMKAAQDAILRHGTSSNGAPIFADRSIFQNLQANLADFLGTEDACLFNSGYNANCAVIGHLLTPRDVIFHDALVHNSSLTGAKLSGARCVPFRHNNFDHLEALLKEIRAQYERALIIVEGAHSTEGDVPELPHVITLKQQYNAALMVDEAHSIGVVGRTGRGICEHFSINPSEVDLLVGSFGKALGSCGGFVAGSHRLIDFLRHTTPGLIFSVAASPADHAAASAALDLLRREPQRVERLMANTRYFVSRLQEEGFPTGEDVACGIVPIFLGDEVKTMLVSDALYKRGLNLKSAVYPATEKGRARLRFFMCAEHEKTELDLAARWLTEEFETVRLSSRIDRDVLGILEKVRVL